MQNERSKKIWAEARFEVEKILGTETCSVRHKGVKGNCIVCGVSCELENSLVKALVSNRRDAIFKLAEGFSGEQELWTGNEIREHLHFLAEMIDVQD